MLVFLDFDGVTHPRTGASPFQSSSMEALRQAFRGFPIEIVVTSTWREDKSLDELRKLLVQLDIPIIAITPVIEEPFTHHVRYHEVQRYLHGADRVQEPWLAIDDTPGFYPDKAPVYWTDPMTGFREQDIHPLQSMIRRVFVGA